MDDTNTMPEGNATNETWQAEAGAGRPLPEARLMDIGRIRRARPQPRAWFDPDELRNLAASIGEHGILAPLIVRPDLEHPGEFILVVGERRLRAAGAIGLTEVPVLVRSTVSNDDAFIQALVENLQRADLTPDERYNALKYLEGRGLSQREIGRRLGYDHTTVNRQLRVQGDVVLGPAVATARITPSQGQELLGVPPEERARLIATIVARRKAGRAIQMGELRAAIKALNAEPGLPSSERAAMLEGSEGHELHRVVARARVLRAHIQEELESLLDYRRHPLVREELVLAHEHIEGALRD